MVETIDIARAHRAEVPSTAPTTYTLAKARLGHGLLAANPLSRKGTFTSTIQLTLERGKLTVAGTYIGHKTGARTLVSWSAYLVTLVVLCFLLWQVTILPVAVGISIAAAYFPAALLDWIRHRPVTFERASAEVTVENVKGCRVVLKGPFELERPDALLKLRAYAHTKEDAAALARALTRGAP